MLDAVPEQIGPYQIIRLLGLGGMAQVYHARKSVEGVDLVVALKVPRQHVVMDQAARERFLKEARITARLGSHPNIVQVLDVGVDGKLPYMALEYVTGVDLGRLCDAMIKTGTRWSEPAILWVLASIIQGLRHAWGAEVAGEPLRIVHRDISPSNILVTYEGQVKVTDFGISRMAGLDTSGAIRGKARYMPYEQILGRATAASDLYAVGAIAYELIEGMPFRYDKLTADEMYLATMGGETPTITRKDVSPRLVQLVTRLLRHRDDQRVQTPMDAWLELKACPGLNLVDPDPVRALLEEFLGQHRQSGYTAVQVRIHPELAATRAALAAAASDQADGESPSEAQTDRATPPLVARPQTPPAATMTAKWPYDGGQTSHPSTADHGAVRMSPPQPTIATPRAEPRRGSRALALTGLGLLLGVGMALGAMKIIADPTIASEARPAAEPVPSEPPSPKQVAQTERPSSPIANDQAAVPKSADTSTPAAVAMTTTRDPTSASAPAALEPATAPEPTTEPEPAPSPAKPKPKSLPRSTLHVRLDLVPELELRIGSKVRRITSSITLPASSSTKEIAIRTPGSTTWYASRVRLEPGRAYLLRLHAKRFDLIPLDESSR